MFPMQVKLEKLPVGYSISLPFGRSGPRIELELYQKVMEELKDGFLPEEGHDLLVPERQIIKLSQTVLRSKLKLTKVVMTDYSRRELSGLTVFFLNV